MFMINIKIFVINIILFIHNKIGYKKVYIKKLDYFI